MSIFLERLILLLVSFSPVELLDHKLIQADFNTGNADVVYKNDVSISRVAKSTYKLTSTDGAPQTFHIYDIVTFVGSYVEFDTCSLKLKIRCIFENRQTARRFVRIVKPTIHSQIEFPLFVIAPVIEGDETYENYRHIEAIVGAELHVELENRFIVVSETENLIEMIFTATHFNISHLISLTRVLLVTQIYEIQKEEIVTLKFLLSFTDSDAASHFYKYMKKDRSTVTDNMISVDIPSCIARLFNP